MKSREDFCTAVTEAQDNKNYRDYRISYFAGQAMAQSVHAIMVNVDAGRTTVLRSDAEGRSPSALLAGYAIEHATALVDALEAREVGELEAAHA